MGFDDEFFNEYDGGPPGSSSGFDVSGEQGGVERGLDPFNYRDPVSAYMFLSGDVQDELRNPKRRKMKCLL